MTPRAALTRHPIAIEVARSAALAAGAEAEVIVFDVGRAFVVAASSPHEMLQPREPTDGERKLMTGDAGPRGSETSGSSGSGSSGSGSSTAVSFPIHGDGEACVGALTVHSHDGSGPIEALAPLTRILSAVVTEGGPSGRTQGFEAHVLRGLRDSVVVVDHELRITWVNEAVGSLFGRTPAEVVGMNASDLLHPDDIETALNAVARVVDGLEMYRVFLRISTNDGEYMPVEVTGFDASENPAIRGLVLSLRAAGSAELGATVERSRRMADAIVGQLHDGIVAADAFGAVTLINDAARRLFGLNPRTPTAHFTLDDFVLVEDAGRSITAAEICDPRFERSSDSALCVVGAGGALRYITVQHRRVRAEGDKPMGSVVVFHDVTAEHLAAEELRRQALHDQLTGLPNRRLLDQRFVELRSDARRNPIAVSFMDLDGFKVVNDMHGHRVGDEVIRIAAERLKAAMRTGDLLVRLGGDEFVAIHREVRTIDDALGIAENLRVALAPPYEVADERFDLTASIGVAFSEDGREEEDRLLQQADIALYSAKARGRNRVVAFTAELADGVLAGEHQRRLLRQALDDDRLVMHFQPLIDSQTGLPCGYEALARIRTDSGDVIGPPAFLDALASSSLLWELDRAAFRLSCEAASIFARVAATDTPPIVACNFSAISLTQRDLVEFISETAAECGVEPRQICIEITESAAFEAGPTVLQSLESLSDLGFALALDDFGTGYSPLSHLRDLPISTVKVDRTFIASIGEESNERAIAEAVVVLAKQLGLDVVAEGVESESHRHHATQLGFSTLQGWHYAPAMPLPECLAQWVGGAMVPER